MADQSDRLREVLSDRYRIESDNGTVNCYSEAEASARRYATRPEGRWLGVSRDASVRSTAEPTVYRRNTKGARR